jgi:hypothetical protein
MSATKVTVVDSRNLATSMHPSFLDGEARRMKDDSASIEDIGIHLEEMDKYMDLLKSGVGNPARQICICGHSLSRHTKSEPSSYCNVAKAWCDCAEPLPVLEPEDLRTFVFSTNGVGKKHALAKGLHALRKNGKSARWLIERLCFRCGVEGRTVYPTALTRDKRIARGAGHTNALLCESCVNALGGYPTYY